MKGKIVVQHLGDLEWGLQQQLKLGLLQPCDFTDFLVQDNPTADNTTSRMMKMAVTVDMAAGTNSVLVSRLAAVRYALGRSAPC